MVSILILSSRQRWLVLRVLAVLGLVCNLECTFVVGPCAKVVRGKKRWVLFPPDVPKSVVRSPAKLFSRPNLCNDSKLCNRSTESTQFRLTAIHSAFTVLPQPVDRIASHTLQANSSIHPYIPRGLGATHSLAESIHSCDRLATQPAAATTESAHRKSRQT